MSSKATLLMVVLVSLLVIVVAILYLTITSRVVHPNLLQSYIVRSGRRVIWPSKGAPVAFTIPNNMWFNLRGFPILTSLDANPRVHSPIKWCYRFELFLATPKEAHDKISYHRNIGNTIEETTLGGQPVTLAKATAKLKGGITDVFTEAADADGNLLRIQISPPIDATIDELCPPPYHRGQLERAQQDLEQLLSTLEFTTFDKFLSE